VSPELPEGTHPEIPNRGKNAPHVEIPPNEDLADPVVVQLRDRLQALDAVSTASLPRALTLISTLVNEAERHEHRVAVADDELPAICFQDGTLNSTLLIGEESERVVGPRAVFGGLSPQGPA
jgi:hypothetical protein